MGGRGEPRNLDDFAAVSRGLSRAGSRNLAKFSVENCGPCWWCLAVCDWQTWPAAVATVWYSQWMSTVATFWLRQTTTHSQRTTNTLTGRHRST